MGDVASATADPRQRQRGGRHAAWRDPGRHCHWHVATPQRVKTGVGTRARSAATLLRNISRHVHSRTTKHVYIVSITVQQKVIKNLSLLNAAVWRTSTGRLASSPYPEPIDASRGLGSLRPAAHMLSGPPTRKSNKAAPVPKCTLHAAGACSGTTRDVSVPRFSLSLSLFPRRRLIYSLSLPMPNLSTTLVCTHGVVPSARPMRSGTAKRATLTKANASAPSFCKSSWFEKSGKWPVTP